MSDDDENDNQDRYARTGTAAPVTNVLAEVDGFNPETLGYSDEWWERRDREVAGKLAEQAAAREHGRMLDRAGQLRDNGFPSRFVTAALGELRETPALKQARVFMHLPRKIIVLAGGVGVGKTTGSAWISLKGEDLRPGFIRASELERRGRYDKKLDDWLEDKTSLVIDDIGAEVLDGKNVFRSLFDEIIDMFYGNRRTLVMTTNLRPRRAEPKPDRPADEEPEQEQFVERYGQRVWSRLVEVGVWSDCGTRDMRKELQP